MHVGRVACFGREIDDEALLRRHLLRDGDEIDVRRAVFVVVVHRLLFYPFRRSRAARAHRGRMPG
jgi:hypothetical protein